MTAIPQDAALDLQLAACAGNEPGSSLLEVRYRRPDKSGMGRHFIPLHERRQAAEIVRRLAVNDDVFFGVAPRARRGGGTDSIDRCWTLHIDADDPHSLAAVLAFEPAAAVVVESGGGGGHGYWPLRAPLAPEHAARANRRLAHHLGGDMAATDAARILRPAGTLNYKHDAPAPVVCVRLELLSYDASNVVGHLPDPPEQHRTPVAALPRPGGPNADELQSVPATFYVPALTGRDVGRDGKSQCPFHAGGEERTPSLQVYTPPTGPGSWFCFACQRGGSIIDLGALLYDLAPRGRGYWEIRRRLAGDLLGHFQAGVAA